MPASVENKGKKRFKILQDRFNPKFGHHRHSDKNPTKNKKSYLCDVINDSLVTSLATDVP